MVPKLETQTLESLSDIKVSFQIGKHPGKSYERDVLVVQYSGTYGIGSGGNSDAVYMTAMGKAAIEAFDPDALILDMTRLSYEWGDLIEQVFDVGENRAPVALIVGENCRIAIGTLCFGENSTTDACEEDWIFDSLNDAWKFVTKLVDDGEMPPLHEAAKAGDSARVKKLIEAGEDPNREDREGNRPLHRVSNVSVAKLLIDAGADVTVKNRHGVTPLHITEELELARLFIDSGADPDARTLYGGSALCGASTPEMAKFLIDAGADVEQRARPTLLHHVRNPDTARVFVEAGVHVNALDENGKTPLDAALQNKEIFLQQSQREWGSRADSETSRKYEKIANLLRKYGGKTSVELDNS